MRYTTDMSFGTDSPPPRESAADHAYERVKEAIVRGELAGGDVISELAVSESLRLSRTPVHEAFLRLSSERLLALEARKGAVVLPMAPQEQRNVLEMHEAIEAAAATRLIADHAAASVADSLNLLVEEQRTAVAQSDVDAFLRSDDAFHMAVVEACGNDLAAQLMNTLRDRQQRLRYQLLRVQPEHMVSGLAQHEQLVDALVSYDARGYRKVLAKHVATHRGTI